MTIELLTNGAWECGCDKPFIHPPTETVCKMCGVIKEESPDARVEDVDTYMKYWANTTAEYKTWAHRPKPGDLAPPVRLSQLLTIKES